MQRLHSGEESERNPVNHSGLEVPHCSRAVNDLWSIATCPNERHSPIGDVGIRISFYVFKVLYTELLLTLLIFFDAVDIFCR